MRTETAALAALRSSCTMGRLLRQRLPDSGFGRPPGKWRMLSTEDMQHGSAFAGARIEKAVPDWLAPPRA
jgi:hypothetical protein